MEILGPEFDSEDPIVNMDANGKEGRDGTIPKGRSIAHTIFNNQRSVFLSFDIETAGERAGIVQISAEILRFKINSVKKTVGSDYAKDIECVADTFNSYVNPEVLPEYWDQKSISVHGILPDDERIKNAGIMQTVWPEFQSWFWSIVSPSEPMNTTSCGSPGGKTNIQVHMGDQRLAQRSSSPISYAQQKASVIFSLQFFHWHSSSKSRNLQKNTAMMIG